MNQVECAHDSMVDTATLVPNPRNPNKHPAKQIELLAKIIKHTGWRNPIVVSNRSGFIVKGHARLEAAKILGEEQVPVDYQDYPNEAMEWADMVADNRIAELAEPDLPSLKDILQELDTGDFDMDLTGFDDKALEELMTQTFQPKDGLTDDDAIPEPKETICKAGDLWLLGRHRLLCGDSTKPEDVARLMAGEKISAVVTDPPYGISVDTSWLSKLNLRHKSKPNKSDAQLANDDGSLDLTSVFTHDKWFVWGFPYIAHPSMTGWLVWDKWPDRQSAIDAKLGNPCEMALTNLWTGFRVFRLLWRGFFRAKGEERLAHPTQKPMGVVEPVVASIEGDIADFYLGSGTTMIACEKLNRRCYGMEIDEHYNDVILERWANYTGQDPVREDGRTWSNLKRDAQDVGKTPNMPEPITSATVNT